MRDSKITGIFADRPERFGRRFGGVLAFSLLAWFSVGVDHAVAQSTAAGTVSGKVADAQGAAVVGADVTLIDTNTNIERTTTTNGAGRYSFINVTPGVYDVTASKTGFTRTRISAQTVDVGLALTLDVTLQVGATATTVEVAAS